MSTDNNGQGKEYGALPSSEGSRPAPAVRMKEIPEAAVTAQVQSESLPAADADLVATVVHDSACAHAVDESAGTEPGPDLLLHRPGQLRVIRRNGKMTHFANSKIKVAMAKAFLAVEGNSAAASRRVHETVDTLTAQVEKAVARNLRDGSDSVVHIEDIQDQVELALMRAEEHKVARAYVLYREKRNQEREKAGGQDDPGKKGSTFSLVMRDGSRKSLNQADLVGIVRECCVNLEGVDAAVVVDSALQSLYDGASEDDLDSALVMGARSLIEKEPDYSYVAARLLLRSLRAEICGLVYPDGKAPAQDAMHDFYISYFPEYVRKGVNRDLLDSRLLQFDLARLAEALQPDRDLSFSYLGLKTLRDRYFIHVGDRRLELPQAFFMRVAMGLALNETDREERAIEFYNVLSSFDFMSSTPTLFNSGTHHPQLSSCYLTTVPDNLDGIYSAIKDDALLSKFAGGLGNDWTNVRAMGAHIRGTNGKSQGIVPFLKVANDTAVAVNQGGKRKGAICAYLEIWHKDIEEFLDLRKNTGDDRRRTHDMNTACWVPDLFMKRVSQKDGRGEWTLFSPDETPDLHELYGRHFEQRYMEYEEKARQGRITNYRTMPAGDLWRKILNMLYETGHPWLTFKDPCNLRSPQQHAGVVHSSNLCTEITLNTSFDEIAVCNLGSINLARHIDRQGLDVAKIERTTRVAMRMLDNVIDINHYSVPAARRSNLKHRPVGLGIMGFQDALYKLRLPYASEGAVRLADRSLEVISYHAIQASVNLAAERSPYPSFRGSLWSRGILPIDSISLLREERGPEYLDIDTDQTLDWKRLREQVRIAGMRNSNCMAIAPTATISNICGVTQSIEPTYQNLYVKSNLSGEFTVVNPYLVRDLKQLELWDDVMVNDLKYFDGSIQAIDRIPAELKELYATVFEVEPSWLIQAASRRQKWIDQAQSFNMYMAQPNGKKLSAAYYQAWRSGLKTTYYLRTLGATHLEKSTMDNAADANRLNAVPQGDETCSLSRNEECEACQ